MSARVTAQDAPGDATTLLLCHSVVASHTSPSSPRRRYAHTLLACKGVSSSTGAGKCAVVHRGHNAADNIAHIMQLQARLAGCRGSLPRAPLRRSCCGTAIFRA
jgi:hypothetical protein